MKKMIILIFIVSMFVEGISFARIIFDAKIGLFGIQDPKGESSYVRLPEISLGFGKFIKKDSNILLGMELDYYNLPANFNLWGTKIDTEIKAATYCNLDIKKNKENFEVEIVFDV